MAFEFEYFYGDESTQFSFFRIPRQLMTSPMFKGVSTDAKLLYGMLLDRMGLSAKHGWYDDQGRVYIYFTVDEVRENLCCGNDKALKILAELDTKKGVGLIERVKQGQGKPTKIYVKRFTTQAIPPQPTEPISPTPQPVPPARGPEVGNPDLQASGFPRSRHRESRSADLGQSEGSYTNQVQTDFSYPDPSIHPAAPPGLMDRYEQEEKVRQQINFDILAQKFSYDDVESLLELIVDVAASTAPTLRIGREELSTETVRARFAQLDSSHVEYVLDALQNTTTQIRNIRAYLLTALYNAPVTMGQYYAAAVRHDFG